jgi:hypothetical protein
MLPTKQSKAVVFRTVDYCVAPFPSLEKKAAHMNPQVSFAPWKHLICSREGDQHALMTWEKPP